MNHSPRKSTKLKIIEHGIHFFLHVRETIALNLANHSLEKVVSYIGLFSQMFLCFFFLLFLRELRDMDQMALSCIKLAGCQPARERAAIIRVQKTEAEFMDVQFR